MGLCAMQDVPDMDQAMRFANIANQMAHIPQNAWVGEQNLNGLGLRDGSDVPTAVNAISNGATQVIGALAQLKAAKKGKAAPAAPHPVAAAPASMTSSGGDNSKWLVYGGLALVGVVVLVMVLKKKKKGGGGEE